VTAQDSPSIGSVRDDEIGALVGLMHSTIAPLSYYNESAIRAELAKYTPDELRSRVAGDPSAALVARNGDALVGYCVSRFDNGTIYLDWYATDPEARGRGRGIGISLLAALAETLPSRRAHKIWCDSRTDNKESNSVLERFGFRRITTLVNHWYGQDYFLWEWLP
jgi:ribosomal protein S18 acetylase RimI-like enzyme